MKPPVSWRTDIDIYKRELAQAVSDIKRDTAWLEKMERFYPNVDIVASIDKAVFEYWSQECGWRNKKQKRGQINWRLTFSKALNMAFNRVYKNKQSAPMNGRGFVV